MIISPDASGWLFIIISGSSLVYLVSWSRTCWTAMCDYIQSCTPTTSHGWVYRGTAIPCDECVCCQENRNHSYRSQEWSLDHISPTINGQFYIECWPIAIFDSLLKSFLPTLCYRRVKKQNSRTMKQTIIVIGRLVKLWGSWTCIRGIIDSKYLGTLISTSCPVLLLNVPRLD